MSEMHSGARHVDPLDALRAADHRPIHHVWRERLIHRAREGLGSISVRPLVYLVVTGVAVAIVWQLFDASAPPVESSIPYAQPSSVEPAAPAVATSVAAEGPTEGVADASEAPLVVHVAGAVKSSGLVTGEPGWRIDDAVRAAGGAVPGADLDRLNLAAPIADGERIYVPLVGESEPSVVSPSGGSREASGTGAPAVVDVNTATAAELETLPGIGPATAATIIAHREEHGSFADVDALVAVRGIGPATLESLRDHVRTS